MSEEDRAQQQQQQAQREEMKRQMIQAMLEPEARERRECTSSCCCRQWEGAGSFETSVILRKPRRRRGSESVLDAIRHGNLTGGGDELLLPRLSRANSAFVMS